MSNQNPFQRWVDLCISEDEPSTGESSQGGSDEIALRLKKEACSHFQALSQSHSSGTTESLSPSSPRTKDVSTIEQDISKASSATPNGALALLVSSLGPAITSATDDAKGRGLHCLLGALEGCTSLTQGVRQAVGRFLVELCRPESGEQEHDDEENDDADQPMDYVDAGDLTPGQVTQQLQAMQQRRSGERSKKGSKWFAHDDVRDAAMTCLTALLRSQIEIFPTQQSQSPQAKAKSPLNEAMAVVQESMELRIELALLGVRYRCQVDSSDPNNDGNGIWGGAGAGYETGEPDLNIADGLSKLPRLKRSICFNLLDGALDGFEEDGLKWSKLQSQLSSSGNGEHQGAAPPSLLRSISTFAILASSCMHGETDPRCLLQLLRLLNKTQQVMMPLFDSNCNGPSLDADVSEVTFPSIDIFDAVAPYYPVHFTPPKNDPHGITCEMLQDALMAVLCERDAFYNQRPTGQEEKETMITLAARMFLERLEPPKSSDYDPPSNGSESDADDKLEAIRDLSSLLLHRPSSARNGMVDDKSGQTAGLQQQQSNVTRVAPSFLSELSSSMARVHEEAVSSDAKTLASAVRKFSASLSRTLEPAAISTKNVHFEEANTTLWEAFVVDNLRHLAPILGTAPQGTHGRASTAYLASLAAEGGLMALNKVLEACYPRFLGVLSLLDRAESDTSPSNASSTQQKARDEEKLGAAMRGIVALVSSSRVALHQHERENIGVQVHPHPLSLYISDTIQKIALVLNEPRDGDDVGSLQLAAVGALESVLISADLNGLKEEDMASLEKTFSLVPPTLFDRKEEDCSSNKVEWKTACARVLGAVIALGLCQEECSDDSTPSNHKMNAVATSLLPKVLASSTSPHPGSSKSNAVRYDWMVLSRACANGTSLVSQKIVSEIISKILDALRSREIDPKPPAMALAYLTRHGGPGVGATFHNLTSPPTPFDLIEALCQSPREDTPEDREVTEQVSANQRRVGLSLLQLPESRAKDEEAARETITTAYSILPFIIPAYQCPSSASSCNGLVQLVDQVLPPLSIWDGVRLCVAFPLLKATLENSKTWKDANEATRKTLRSMIPYLAEFAISSDHEVHSRSAAASCLFSILLHNTGEEFDGVQSIKKILHEVVQPALANTVASLSKELSDVSTPRASANQAIAPSNDSLHCCLSRFQDAMAFLSLLGSTSSCKGGDFSQAGDEIASFLMELACTGSGQFPFTDTAIQLIKPSEQGQKHPILDPASHAQAVPASAYGSLLSVQNGGPFWRQRMTHKTLPILLNALKLQAKSRDPPALGVLAVVCHMLCCLPASTIGKSNIQQILPTMIAGLVYFSKNLEALVQCDEISPKSMEILSTILAALAKILTVSPKDVTKFVGIIIPSLLLLSSPTEPSEAYIPKQLLLLQCLEIVASHPHARNAILREKEQVVAVLSAMVDHPSMLVRNAVVQVRNVWCTIE